MSKAQPEITPEILQTIDILEVLENLLDIAPSPAVEQVLRESWLKLSETLPEDFREATREDAGAEGLRRYIRVKAFFSDPAENSISREDLEVYYQNRADSIDEDATDFFFPE